MLSLITNHFGENKNEILKTLINLMKDQKNYLIDGKINDEKPKDIEKRSGIAYLQG